MDAGSAPEDEKVMDEIELDLEGDSACRESTRSLTRFGSITQQMRQGYHSISRSLRKARAGVSRALDAPIVDDPVRQMAYNERYTQRSPTPAPPNSKIKPTGSPLHTPSSLRNRTNLDGSITRESRHQSPFSFVKRKDSHQNLLLSSSPPAVPSTERSQSPSPATKSILYRSHGPSIRHKLQRARSSLSLSSGKMRTVEVQDSVERRRSSPILIGGGRIPMLNLDLEHRPLSAMVSVDPRFERSEESTSGAADTFVVGTPPRTPAPIDHNVPPTLIYGSASEASPITSAQANDSTPLRLDETRSTSAWSGDARNLVDTHKLTEAVKHTLRLAFLKDHEPTDAGLADLADDLGLCSSQVAAWFKETRTAVIRHSLLGAASFNSGNFPLKDFHPSGALPRVDTSRTMQGRVRSVEPEDPFLSATGQGRERSYTQQISNSRANGEPEQTHHQSANGGQSLGPIAPTSECQPTHARHAPGDLSCLPTTTSGFEQSTVPLSPKFKGRRSVDVVDDVHASERVRRVCIVNGRPVSNLEERTATHLPLPSLEGSNTDEASECCAQQASNVPRGSRPSCNSHDMQDQIHHNGDFHPDLSVNTARTLNENEDYGYDNRHGRYVKLPELKHRVFAKVLNGVDPAQVNVSVSSSQQKADIHLYLRPPPFGTLPNNGQAGSEDPTPQVDQGRRMRGGWTEEQLANTDDLYEISDQEQDTLPKPRTPSFDHGDEASDATTDEDEEHARPQSTVKNQKLNEESGNATSKSKSAKPCDALEHDAVHNVADTTSVDAGRNGSTTSPPNKAKRSKRKAYRVAKGNQTADVDGRRRSKVSPKTERNGNARKSGSTGSESIEELRASIELSHRSKIKGEGNRPTREGSQGEEPNEHGIVETAALQGTESKLLHAS